MKGNVRTDIFYQGSENYYFSWL